MVCPKLSIVLNPFSLKSTRGQFDEQTARLLDVLKLRYGIVEVIQPNRTDAADAAWFVQIYKTTKAELATGFYGDTAYQAAKRLVLKYKLLMN